ncbi:MAG TPA: hypothetical protein VFU99_03640 [Gaiellaceae bacterium]|nr:hypothetical protein [Gaiellaceae bacterium]
MTRTIMIVVAAISLVGPTAQAGNSENSGAALSGPFVGRYKATLTQAQAAGLGDWRMTGKFSLVIRRNGTYTVSNPLDGRINGKVAALANRRLRFYEDTGCLAGGFERDEGGTYRWSVKPGQLILRLVSEGPCTGRTQSLTYPVWKRV